MTDALVEDDSDAPLSIEAGRVLTDAVEINAAWHCNIRCEWCSHASPTAPSRFADVTSVSADLSCLAKWLRADHVRILGGEPLLHPHLVDLLSGAKESGVGARIRVVTNGLALHKVDAAFWRLTDEVHVSMYPSTAGAIERHLDDLKTTAANTDTTLVLKYFDRFRVAYREPSNDTHLTERIYRTCQIANLWRCLTVEGGRLYRCPQATHVHMAAEYSAYRGGHGGDYLDIGQIESADEVLVWLRQPTALNSCQACAGSVGDLQPHRQIRSGRLSEVGSTVDRTYLQLLETDRTASNSCVGREVVVWEVP